MENKMKNGNTMELSQKITRSISFLHVNGYVNEDIHGEIYREALELLVYLDKGVTSIFKTASKRNGNVIIDQLRSYEAMLIIDIETAMKSADVSTKENLNRMLQFVKSTGFDIKRFASKKEINQSINKFDFINADAIEKIWNCSRAKRTMLLGAVAALGIAGITTAILYKRKEMRSTTEAEESLQLLDFSEQHSMLGDSVNDHLVEPELIETESL